MVLPHSYFLSRHIGFKEHGSVKHETVSGHTENPLHESRVNIIYISKGWHWINKEETQRRGYVGKYIHHKEVVGITLVRQEVKLLIHVY